MNKQVGCWGSGAAFPASFILPLPTSIPPENSTDFSWQHKAYFAIIFRLQLSWICHKTWNLSICLEFSQIRLKKYKNCQESRQRLKNSKLKKLRDCQHHSELLQICSFWVWTQEQPQISTWMSPVGPAVTCTQQCWGNLDLLAAQSGLAKPEKQNYNLSSFSDSINIDLITWLALL